MSGPSVRTAIHYSLLWLIEARGSVTRLRVGSDHWGGVELDKQLPVLRVLVPKLAPKGHLLVLLRPLFLALKRNRGLTEVNENEPPTVRSTT